MKLKEKINWLKLHQLKFQHQPIFWRISKCYRIEYSTLKTLINDREIRDRIGDKAYNVCKKKYNTIYTGIKLTNYINKII